MPHSGRVVQQAQAGAGATWCSQESKAAISHVALFKAARYTGKDVKGEVCSGCWDSLFVSSMAFGPKTGGEVLGARAWVSEAFSSPQLSSLPEPLLSQRWGALEIGR